MSAEPAEAVVTHKASLAARVTDAFDAAAFEAIIELVVSIATLAIVVARHAGRIRRAAPEGGSEREHHAAERAT